MLARCARCQGNFTTDHFGVQTCPHCGSEILLSDPSAPTGPPAPGQPAAAPPAAAGPATPPAPPPQGAPPGGYGPPPAGPGWGPPPSGPPPGPPPGGFGGPPGAGPGQGPKLASPFAERSRRGFLPAFLETFKLVAVQPADFFRRVRLDQSGSAVFFGVLAATVGSVFGHLYNLLGREATLKQLQEAPPPSMPPQLLQFYEMMTRALESSLSGVAMGLQILVSPILALFFIYLSAAVLHLVLMLFRGAGQGFDGTLTVVAYANGLFLLAAVPVCGFPVGLVWYLVVLIIGLSEAQRCGPGKAVGAVFAPAILLCLCVCLGAFAVAGFMIKSFAPGAGGTAL